MTAILPQFFIAGKPYSRGKRELGKQANLAALVELHSFHQRQYKDRLDPPRWAGQNLPKSFSTDIIEGDLNTFTVNENRMTLVR